MSDPQITLPTAPTLNAPPDTSAAFDAQINNILSSIPESIKVTSTPYIVGHDSEPTLPFHKPLEMSDQNVQPVNNSVQERKLARQQNTFSALGNTVKSFINTHEEKKQYELTSNIKTVMKAQAQIDNAKTVLASDPNNAMAKSVLEQNMKIIDSKLSDHKLRNQIGKAFDISFIDPSKNDTPEIKAGETARKQVEAETAAGTIHDTPQEKALAEQVANGGRTPTQQKQVETANKVTTPHSSPSYAEQFLGKLPATISSNPQYQAELAAQQARDKQITQYVIPKLLDTLTKKEIEDIRQGNGNARAELKSSTDMYIQMMKSITAAGIADAKDRTSLQRQAMADRASMGRAILHANVALKIGEMKGIKGTIHQAKMEEDALKTFQTIIDQTDKDDTELSTKLLNTTDPKVKADINHRLDMNKLKRRQAADEMQKFMTKIYGSPQAGPNDEVTTGNTKGYFNGGSSNSTSKSTTEAGESLSDSSDESEDDDSDEDAAINSIDIENQ